MTIQRIALPVVLNVTSVSPTLIVQPVKPTTIFQLEHAHAAQVSLILALNALNVLKNVMCAPMLTLARSVPVITLLSMDCVDVT